MNTPPHRRIIDALHRSRMQPYIDAAHQNEKNALRLYQWNSNLSAALHAVLGTTEVVLRNAMDRELQTWNNAETNGTQSWLLTAPAHPLRSLSAGKRKQANAQAQKESEARPPTHPRHKAPVSHDDILAQVMFGLWKDLLPNHMPNAGHSPENSGREILWKNALKNSFPNEADPDGSVTFWRVAHLHQLRNRVSHMEPLLKVDVTDHVNEAFALIKSTDVDVANWVTGGSQVSAILKLRPDV